MSTTPALPKPTPLPAPADAWANGGLVLIDKPLEWTSFDAVAKVRRLLGGVKVGHAGTLDPLATGLLILATGKWTKRLQELQAAEPKVYVADLQLGATTESYDAEHPPQPQADPTHIKREELEIALRRFQGWIDQMPPPHSAVKVGGQRAYQLARGGRDPQLQPRRVYLERLKVLAHDAQAGTARLEVACGKGTYIRSLAHDLGQALGVGAYLAGLRRTAIGPYRADQALTPQAFEAKLAAASGDARPLR